MKSFRSRSPRGQDGRRISKRAAVSVIAAGVAAMGATSAIVASAAVPTFPDNIVVFPDRDFITVEGYQNHIGETATIEVTRGNTVIGSAQGVVAEGDVAFEINHPGGYCWGNGTDLKVTPDIRPGDKATIKFAGDAAGDTTVQDTFVTGNPVLDDTTNTVTITGHVATSVIAAQMEQRVVNPDLVPTAIGRRDVRAVPGPLTPAPKGGYSSSLDVTGDTFTATYVFDDLAVAKAVATGGGVRVMAWQEEDADANRQGLSISEYGEAGGPGMGGCPAGPGDLAAPQPGTAAVARSADKTSMQVNWTPAKAQPGAAPVTGYSVAAIAQGTGERVEIGRRTSDTATRTTITGLSATQSYDVEVRSLAGPRMSEAFTVQVPAPAVTGDRTAPTLASDPPPLATGVRATDTVTLTSDETGADIYYTLGGAAVIDGSLLPTEKAILYTKPIAISAKTEINAVAIDRAGNRSVQLTGTFEPPPAAPAAKPSAPMDMTGTAGQQSVTLKWTSSDPSITGFGIQVYDSANAPVGTLYETTAKTLTIKDLAPNKAYYFGIKARNAVAYGDEYATRTGPVTPTQITDQVTITKATWKTGDFRVVGTGSVVGAIVTVRPALPGGGIDKTTSLGSATVTAGAAPGPGDYDVRLRNGAAPAPKPATVYVESDGKGVAGPFAVANG